MKKLPLFLAALLLVVLAAPATAQNRPAKVDLALVEALNAGCATEDVIIRTRPGFRGGLAAVLKAERNQDAVEHHSINALTARVDCEDIETLDGFDEVL
jgi:hypothetical protein